MPTQSQLTDQLIDAAGTEGNSSMMQQLIAAGADINGCGPALCGATPLIAAIFKEAFGNALWLIANGADPCCAGGARMQPLLFACERQFSMPVVQALLDSGADPDACCLAGKSLLIHAIGRCNLPLAQALLAAGADPDARYAQPPGIQPQSLSALEYALRGALAPDAPGQLTPMGAQLLSIADLLLSAGAMHSKRNLADWAAKAQASGNAEALAMLERHICAGGAQQPGQQKRSLPPL